MAVPIKIAIVLRPASGGMARHVETLLAALNASRVEFVIFAPASTRLHLHNIRRVDLEIPAAVSPIRDLKAIAALRRRLEADSIRLVHAHGLRTLWICASAARGQGLPLLFTAHNVPRVSLMSRLILKRAISAGFRAIAVSNAVADRLRLLGVPHGFISVIPNGINLSEFTALPPVHAVRESWKLAQNDLVIAGVGRLSEEKGFQILLEAAARLFGRFPHLRLLIAGDGPMAPQLRERARELEDSAGTQRIRFCGQISNVAGLLAASNVVAVPSLTEGQGIAAIEAMAAERPVVASNTGGLPETVRDGETGILAPPGDVEALSAALAALLEDPALSARLGRAGRLRAIEQYDANTMARKVLQIYREMAVCGD